MDAVDLDLRFRAAAEQAVQSWPLTDPELELVTISENVTYRATAAEGEFVLRLHRPGYHSLAELVSEREWTGALADADIQAPQGLRSRGGDYYVRVNVDAADSGAAEKRFVGVAEWIEGKPLQALLKDMGAAERLQQFELLGRLIATLHNHTSAWRPSVDFTRHVLDVDGFFGESPFWGRFWESPALSAAQYELVCSTRDSIGAYLQAYGMPSATFGLIHADLHFGNVLRQGDKLAIIDFDDAGFGWHQYDLAVALDPGDDEAKNALLRGYRSTRSLSQADASLIEVFFVVRAMASLGWIEQRPELREEQWVHQHVERLCAKCEALVLPPL